MKLKPLLDYVIVERDPVKPATTIPGFHVIDSSMGKGDVGTVAAVGPGRYKTGELVPVGVEVGQRILFGKHTGQTFKVDGEEFFMLRSEDIHAILK